MGRKLIRVRKTRANRNPVSNSACRNLVDCANRTGCSDTACAAMKCQPELAAALATDAGGAAGLATTFAGCLTPKCGPKCSGDGGGTDAPSDAPTSDAPTSDAPATSDAAPEAAGD